MYYIDCQCANVNLRKNFFCLLFASALLQVICFVAKALK